MMRSRWIGAVAGGAVAGAALSALLLIGEYQSGKPSGLIDLKRTADARIGRDEVPVDALPSARERALVQGSHLAFAALAGGTYALAILRDARVIPSGIVFGVTFYAAAQWIAGPLLGVETSEWRPGGSGVGMHATNHILFGLAVAAAASTASRPAEEHAS